jgi:hypothetical protein
VCRGVLTPAEGPPPTNRPPPAGKLLQRMLTAAKVCTTSSDRLFLTVKQPYLVDTGSDLCFFPRKLPPGRWERTDYNLYAANGTNTSARPSARCGTSPTRVTAIYHASPDDRLHRRTHSSAASPDPCATLDNQLHRTDSLACSSTDRLPRHPNASSRPPTPRLS